MTEVSGIYNFEHPATLAHPKNLFVPRAFTGKNGKPKGDPKYAGDFLFSVDNEDLKKIKAKVRALAEAAWPGISPQDIHLPWTSGDVKADKAAAKAKVEGKESKGEYQRGYTIITARSNYQPVLSAVVDGKIHDYNPDTIKTAEAKFYFGVDVLAQLNFEVYDVDGKRGITAYVNSVLSLNKGKRIGNSRAPGSETFKGYVGSSTPEDPTAGDDGAPAETNW